MVKILDKSDHISRRKEFIEHLYRLETFDTLSINMSASESFRLYDKMILRKNRINRAKNLVSLTCGDLDNEQACFNGACGI